MILGNRMPRCGCYVVLGFLLFRLKPHLGSSAVPFMNSIVGAALISAFSRALSASLDATGVAAAFPSACGGGADPPNAFTLAVSAAAFAPSRRSETAPLMKKIMVGTATMAWASATSGCASGSIRANLIPGCDFAMSFNTCNAGYVGHTGIQRSGGRGRR